MHSVAQEKHLAKISIIKYKLIIQKNSYESIPNVYDSVDVKSLSWGISLRSTESYKFMQQRVTENEKL